MDTKPMSQRKRNFYFFLFVILFIIIAPIIILYSSGYGISVSKGEGIFGLIVAKKGGIFVSVPETGTNVYLNGLLYKTTNIFQRDLFFDRLPPKEYSVSVEKEGFTSWQKQMEVFPERVTEGYPFLLALDLEVEPVERRIFVNNATTTNPLYEKVEKLFVDRDELIALEAELKNSTTTTATTTATTTEAFPLIRKKIALKITEEGVMAIWTGNENEMPFYFCKQDELEKVCQAEKAVLLSGSVKRVDFYLGRQDVFLIATGNKIMVIELDTREPQNSQVIYRGSSPDFILEGDELYIRDNKEFFVISL